MRNDILERKEEILQWIDEKLSNKEIALRLKCKVDTLKSYYKKWNIEYSGNKSFNHSGGLPKKSLKELLENPITTSHRIRLKILEENVKEHKCENCNKKIESKN